MCGLGSLASLLGKKMVAKLHLEHTKEMECAKVLDATEEMAQQPEVNALPELPFRNSDDEFEFWTANKTVSTSSNFLNLPGELRNLIYEHALCGHNIHIKALIQTGIRVDELELPCRKNKVFIQPSPKNPTSSLEYTRFRRTVCQAPDHFSQAHEESKLVPEPDKNGTIKYAQSEPDTKIHCDCRARLTATRKQYRTSYQKNPEHGSRHFPRCLPLALLATCRTVYNEACLLPFTGNTFSFDTTDHLTKFTSLALSKQQREALHSIHLAIDQAQHDRTHPLLSALKQSTVDSMLGLRDFRITVEGKNGFTVFNKPVRVVLVKEGLRVRVLIAPPPTTPIPGMWNSTKPLRHLAWEIEEILEKNEDALKYGWIKVGGGVS